MASQRWFSEKAEAKLDEVEAKLELADASGSSTRSTETAASGAFAFQAVDLDDLFGKFSRDATEGADLLRTTFRGGEALLSGLACDAQDGIKASSLESRKEAFGSNAIPPKEPTSYLEFLCEALKDLTMIMLCISAVVQLILGFSVEVCGHGIEKSWMEPFAITVSVLVVINVTAISDWSQEQDLRKQNLANNAGKKATVTRDGVQEVIHPDAIVVGDLVTTEVGDVAAADGICLSAANLKLDEASLTGEPDKMAKLPFAECPQDEAFHKVNPFILGGTTVVEGKGTMIVTRVGTRSSAGVIEQAIKEADDKKESSELRKKLDLMVTKISTVGVLISVSTSIIMLISWAILHFGYGKVANEATNTPAFWADTDDDKKSWDDNTDPDFLVDVFVTAVTILVVAIPEGLPLAVTLALTYSVKQMVFENLTVKKIDSAETMGSATTICTDKTGTLTKNIMVVVAVLAGGQEDLVLRPDNPDGNTPEQRQKIMSTELSAAGYSDKYQNLLADSICINSSDKSVVKDVGEMNYKYDGNATDCALLALCYEMGHNYEEVRARPDVQCEDRSLKIGRNNTEVVPFASEIKLCMWAVPHGNGIRVYCKGAGERVLSKCSKYLALDGETEIEFDEHAVRLMDKKIMDCQNSAFRVITTAYRDFEDREHLKNFSLEEDLEALNQQFTLIAVTGIQDPLKDTIKGAISRCFDAGVDVRMITGDNKRTAVAIAINAGILREEHFEHVQKEHPSYKDKELRKKYQKHYDELIAHKTMKEIRRSMKKHGYKEDEIDAFIVGCKDCRGRMIKKNGQEVFENDPLVALRENFALEGTEFAKKVHSEEYMVPHYSFQGEASNDCYGVEVIGEDGVHYADVKQADGQESQLPMGVNQEALDAIWPRLRVMARCHPMDKQTLVSGLMESEICHKKEVRSKLLYDENIWIFGDSQVVAVTGDGTNDAPALKKANVGFAMGIAGTEVAKGACDIIVMDDNFSSVVTALKWGRNVYDSVAKFLQFQLTVNVVAVIVASTGAIIYQSSPLGAVQMLWVNLVMDSLGSLALATEKPAETLLDRKPYGRKMSMISRPMRFNIIGQSLYQLAVVMSIMFHGEVFLYNGSDRSDQQNALDGSDELISGRAAGCDPTQHYTVLFNAFVMMTLFNQIAARKLNNEINLFAGVTENKMFVIIMAIEFVAQALFVQFLGNFAECYDEGLTWRQWIWCFGFGIGVWPAQTIINLVVKYTAGDQVDEEEKKIVEDIRTSSVEPEASTEVTGIKRIGQFVSETRLRAHNKLNQSTHDLTKEGHQQHQALVTSTAIMQSQQSRQNLAIAVQN